ncbi:cilia- and flagella-associated protein 65 [Xylocopa sonorina]|uniref:cilia- and flagella-associated protein 65 n=1 Tax=Xylocopa sonorina TaxID=1818115 RepID=UPI00403AF181
MDFENKMKVNQLDYGDVEVGTTAVRTIKIWNESCMNQIYQVQRDSITNPLDHVFHLRSYTWTLAPDEKFLCEIHYRPIIAPSKNVDYFIITDTSGGSMKIVTYGSSIGPEVTCSAKKIFMHCTNETSQVKRRIKLMNKSKVAATFMFNIDEKHKNFQLDTRCGVIEPCSHKYITITFTPLKDERCTYYLAILILYQEPIVIELHGSLSYEKDDIDYITFPWNEKEGFKGYMRDVIQTLEDLPPVSLSKHYFNFGQADVDVENVIHRIPRVICLTNHNQSNLLIVWEKDTNGIFNITPSEMLVRANHSALFELTFNPNTKNNLFRKEIIGSVFLEHKQLSFFPFATTVTVIGHSFPLASNGWIPQYEVPQTVVMPPCAPLFPVYTTFLIKKFGHLPLMFQFISPLASHFTVKPMLGVIYQNYQIVVVEMISEPKNEQIYLERWTLYFNGSTKNETYIDFKGYAEHPNVVFNNTNTLSFLPVFPCCQQFAQLEMRNITRHNIKYQFHQLPSELNIESLSGEINANDTFLHECFFSPMESNLDYSFQVQCILIIIKNGTTIGPKCCINLSVHGKSEMGMLQAIPKELNFGDLEYNNTGTLSFDLVNSSSVNIYYKLICINCNPPLENIEEDVKLHPVSETIFSRSQKKTTISITPHKAVYYQFAIHYLIRINSQSDILVAGQSPIRICNVYCMCILPTIKVKNVCTFGQNQRYSVNVNKPFLWRVMQINRLNKVIKNMVPGEKEIVNINLFPMIVNEGTLLIKWIVMNPSRLPIPLVLKQIKQCSCAPIIKSIGYSRQRIETECVHRDLCIMDIKSEILNPKEETMISMNIRYALIGKTVTCWDLDIGHNRHVILNMIIDCFSENESQNHFLITRLINFGQIYFGNKGGMYKAHWIHNITNNDLPYCIDTSNINKLNADHRCEVFSSLTQDGVIKAGTALPLLLKFQPRMFGAYKVTFPITMGDKTEEMTLEGESSFDSRLISIGRPIPSYCACKTPLLPVYFSIDCIDVWCISTHTSIIKMILVYNNLDNDALSYEWRCQEVLELLDVDIFPSKGIISPNTVQSFRVKIYTKGYPCRVDVSIPCTFFNASRRREYQRSIIKHSILNKELEGQLIVTEKDTYMSKSWIKILDKPDRYHKTLNIRCSIQPVEDECIRLSLLKKLDVIPLNTIYFDDSKNCKINKKELLIVTFLLEGMLWDIVNSKKFKQLIEDSLIPERNLYYSQFVMDLWERKQLARRSYISPPLTLIDYILEQILFIIVHEEFSLKTMHLVLDEDIRHRNYLKMSPQEKRIHIKRDFKKDHELFDTGNEFNTEYLRAGFRVSFME